ncbi:MAG: formylglycine-generating enzyme family protein [Kiritimatiellae bacterium]|nr:formylglycine-generating enzyme family protein [Kiritimatiellia bacterium]
MTVAALVYSAQAMPGVQINSVLQRWPWNNKVDINYTVTDGQDVQREVYCKLVFNATVNGQAYTIDGTAIGADASTGTHTATWDNPPAGVKTANCTMTATLLSADVPSGNDYMVIDLANNCAIAFEGLYKTQELSNQRYNTATYKTTKMVLRKVAAGGTYPTGYSGEASNQPRTWTTDRDYYLGIFGVSQSQYTQLGFANPSDSSQLTDSENAATDHDYAAHRPVTKLNYNLLRGSTTAPADAVPVSDDPNSTSYLQRLNLKTGNKFGFDLPTEVMFEIAARAGATTKYWWGQNPNKDYLCCSDNSSNPKAVGLYPANDWGFFDMAGNVATLCRDTRDSAARNLHEALDPWTPVGESTDTQVQFRQGCFLQKYDDYRIGASNRGGYISRHISNTMSGFRVACIMK